MVSILQHLVERNAYYDEFGRRLGQWRINRIVLIQTSVVIVSAIKYLFLKSINVVPSDLKLFRIYCLRLSHSRTVCVWGKASIQPLRVLERGCLTSIQQIQNAVCDAHQRQPRS